jgi:1,4-dihydroxy-2-naphthoate octaprenyltransferase
MIMVTASKGRITRIELGQKSDSKWRNYSKRNERAIIITSLLTLLSAILLIYFAFEDTNLYYSLFYLILGILAILAAIRYTIGATAYGYRGLGDVFVFIFWIVSTMGVNFCIQNK